MSVCVCFKGVLERSALVGVVGCTEGRVPASAVVLHPPLYLSHHPPWSPHLSSGALCAGTRLAIDLQGAARTRLHGDLSARSHAYTN